MAEHGRQLPCEDKGERNISGTIGEGKRIRHTRDASEGAARYLHFRRALGNGSHREPALSRSNAKQFRI